MRDEDPNFSLYKENCKNTSVILANALEFWTKSWQFYWISGEESDWKQKWLFLGKWKANDDQNEKMKRVREICSFLHFFGGCQNVLLNLHFFNIFCCSFESSFFEHFFSCSFEFCCFLSSLGCSFSSILNRCLHQFWMKSLSVGGFP